MEAKENWIVVPYTCYAVIRAEDYERDGNIDQAVAYGFHNDEELQQANDLCKRLNKQ